MLDLPAAGTRFPILFREYVPLALRHSFEALVEYLGVVVGEDTLEQQVC
jgi:hypothetical protein